MILLLLVATLLFGGAGIGLWVALNGTDHTRVVANEIDLSTNDTISNTGGGSALTDDSDGPEETASDEDRPPTRRPHQPYHGATTQQERIDYVRSLANGTEEKWDSVFLWDLIRSVDGGAVSVSALETVLDLAGASRGNERDEAILRALKAPAADVRLAAVRLAQKHELPGTVKGLIEFFEMFRDDRPVALTAIAHLPDPDAKAFVYDLAADQSTQSALRVQAIALLAIAQSEAARGLLQVLTTEEDPLVRGAAEQALKAYED